MIPTQEDEEELPIITADMTEREKVEFYMKIGRASCRERV